MFLIAALLVAAVSSEGTAQAAIQPPPVLYPIGSIRMDHINFIRDIEYSEWVADYVEIRVNPRYSWMDWSQDGCSSPGLASTYNHAYLHACLRHDFTWRTLAVMDRATGKIWNERNRWTADETFKDDAVSGCNITYKERNRSRFIMREWTKCINASTLFHKFLRDWKYDDELTDAEKRSVAAKSQEYVLYPSASASIDCGVVGSANRCLPIHHIEIDGRPLSPQNMAYFAKGRTAKMQVIRANLQAPDGPPTTRSSSAATGELRLTVKWPLRAGETEAEAACPSSGGTRRDQTIDVDYDDWPLPTPIITEDKDYKETALYVSACADTTSATEATGLISIKPLNALYVAQTSRYLVNPAA